MPNRTEAARRKPSQSPLGDYGHCAFSRLHRRSLIVLASRFRASRLTRRDASAIAPQGGGDWRARSSRCGSSGGNHWNQECRGVLGVVQDRVCGRHKLAARRLIRAGVQVAIKAREIAAGNFQAYDVAPPKDIACSPQIHRNFVHLVWIQQLRLLLRITIAQAQNSVSARFIANPSGETSTSLAVKSVSTAEDLAQSSSVTDPVTSISSASGFVE